VPGNRFRAVIDMRPRVPPRGADTKIRELVAVREIVHAFLTAHRPEEVFQYALERVSPLVGATFASIYLIEQNDDSMRLAAACNWPERFRPFLGQMRVRLGLGPSGEAASDRRIVQVPDVFADESLSDWWEVATELGFRAIVAIPLQTHDKVLGAVAFYFAEAGALPVGENGLLQIVADQMAATAEKARLIDDLRRANAALLDSKEELERQYLAALEARRLKDEFLANMSHELRTPLTAVLGYTSLMQEGLAGPLTEEQRQTLGQVASSGERLLMLIDDLLELTALKRGDVHMAVESFDPRELVREVVSVTAGCPENVALRMEIPDGDATWMRSDRRKVLKILTNLLSNAYKFTPEGEICVSIDVRSDVVRFGVRDTGIGIAPESQQLVFEEFRQVDGSSKRAYGGSGLGLALSRELARRLGGEIELHSVPNEGSAFVLELPLEYFSDLPVEPG
jgi:signal transduction histidine kinase